MTGDSGLLGHVQAGFAYGTSFHLRQDSESAIELATRRHLDGVVVDCDGVPGGTRALRTLRNTPANKQTLILAVVNGLTTAEEAIDLGADLTVSKPVQRGRLASILDAAVPKMEREHRRYFRCDVDLAVRFQTSVGQSFSARMKNVSESGMAIQLVDPVRVKGVVAVEFELPSIEPRIFRAKADVVWSDSFVMGMRFLYIDKENGGALQAWLNSLEARSHFREWAQRG